MKGRVATLLLVASVLLHWPFGVAEFTFDDVDFVQVNASIRSIPAAWGAMLDPFPPDQPERALYRPLTNLSYAFDYALSGDEARGFHRTNVLLYLALVLLVHRLALFYLASPGPAFAVALLFSLHPVHTGAVDAVAGRSELLAMLFGLVSILLFLRAVRGKAAGWALAGSLASYALACLSKESGAVLPAVLFAHIALFHPPRDAAERGLRDRALRMVVPFFAVLALYMSLRWAALGRFSPEHLVLAGQPFSVRLLTMGVVFFEYLRLLFFPRVLQIDFYYHDVVGIPTEASASAIVGLLGLAATILALAALVASRLRDSPEQEGDGFASRAVSIVALSIFLIFLLPISHVLDIGALLAERFLLAPSLGFVLLMVSVANELLRRIPISAPRQRAIAAGTLALLALLGGWRSVSRASEWRDNVRLWQVTSRAIPGEDTRALLNLGGAYLDRGELDAAQASFERVLAIQPDDADALGNLGAIQLTRGRYEAARASYLHLVEIHPSDFVAWNNLGLAEAHLIRHTTARLHYQRSIQLNPNYVPAIENLAESERIIAEATAYVAMQRPGAAKIHDPVLLQNLSAACTAIGDVECAEHFAQRARGLGQ